MYALWNSEWLTCTEPEAANQIWKTGNCVLIPGLVVCVRFSCATSLLSRGCSAAQALGSSHKYGSVHGGIPELCLGSKAAWMADWRD